MIVMPTVMTITIRMHVGGELDAGIAMTEIVTIAIGPARLNVKTCLMK